MLLDQISDHRARLRPVLVGALSLSLIGESLVPLQRLTLDARQIASGHLESRVRVRSDDEFGALADAFNNMAGRLSRQINTMKAMSKKALLGMTQQQMGWIHQTMI